MNAKSRRVDVDSSRSLVRRLLINADMRLVSASMFVLLAACAGEDTSTSTSLTRVPGECGQVEVHVIGVSDGGDNGGSTVVLERPGHHVLVLSSHEANNWNVEVKGEAVLDGVYAVGYYPQKVTANVRTQINTESKMEGGAGATGYMYPDTNTDALLKLTSIRVARHATSFHGCATASRWVIGEDMAVSSDCGTGTLTQYNAVLDCDGDNTCGSDGDGDGDTGDGSGDGTLY
jgi:hypothetical protein